jgi:hypothetical protein
VNYQNCYDRFIEIWRARCEPDVFLERHHIVPRCLGGDDSPENLVALTPREHRLAHLLLAKAHPKNPKLVFAANMMSAGRWEGRERLSPDWLRARVSDAARCRVRTEEFKEACRLKWQDEGRLEANSKRMKEYWSNPDNREKQKSRLKAICSDPDRRAKMSDTAKRSHSRPHVVVKHRDNTQGYWDNNPEAEARRQALITRLSKLTPEQSEELVDLRFNHGWSIKQLMSKFNLSKAAVSARLRKAHVTT